MDTTAQQYMKISSGNADYRMHFPDWTTEQLEIMSKDPVRCLFLIYTRPFKLGEQKDNKIEILDSENKLVFTIELFNFKYKIQDVANKVIQGYNNAKINTDKYIIKPDGSIGLTPFADLNREPPEEMKAVMEGIARRKKEMMAEIDAQYQELQASNKLKKQMILKQKEAAIEAKKKEREKNEQK